MVTGLEVVVGKSITSASFKALTAFSGPIRKRISDRRTAAVLKDGDVAPTLVELQNIIDSLDPQSAAQLMGLMKSPEMEKFALEISTKQLLRTCGEKYDELERRIKDEITESINLRLPGFAGAGTVAEVVFSTLLSQVQRQLNLIKPDDEAGISPIDRAALVRSAANMASAATRNTVLLQSLTSLAEIDKFENEYRAAVHSLHNTMRLPHAGTSRQVPFESLFVEPMLRIAEEKDGSPSSSRRMRDLQSHDSLVSILLNHSRIVVLGDPGGGKSTCTLKLVSDISAEGAPALSARVPFLVVLREYAPHHAQGRSIVEYISVRCNTPYAVCPPEHAIEYLLLNGRAIVCFDGLDELLDTGDRRKIVEAVEGFANRYPTTTIVVTSRRIGYQEAALDSTVFTSVQLGSFDHDRTKSYVTKWFALDESLEPARADAISQAFLRDSQFVDDLTSNPLILSLMCGIYAFEGYIPKNRPDVYEKCALLLFERWDKQRGIFASVAFDAHVQSAIRSIAYRIYTHSDSRTTISRSQLIGYVTNYLLQKRFDDELEAEQAAVEFIDFCKGRAWVLTDVGSDVYGFTHRTFLEYFSASHLVRTNTSAEALLDRLAERICKAEWDVVCQLALQILGKSVDDGADEFLEKLITSRLESLQDIFAIRNVLFFAIRALSFIVPRPSIVKAIVWSIVDFYCDTESGEKSPKDRRRDESDSPVQLISRVTAENRAQVSKHLIERIRTRLSVDPRDDLALAIALYFPEMGRGEVGQIIADLEPDYWTRWSSDRAVEFRGVMLDMAPHKVWVAVYLLALGDISMRDLLEWHGLQALFNPIAQLPGLLKAPIAYMLLISRSMAEENPYLTTMESTTAIREYIDSTPPPWVVTSELEGPSVKWSQFADRIRGERFWRFHSVFVILYAIGMEIDEKIDDKGDRDNFASAIARNEIELPPDLSSLIKRWLDYEVSFVAL